MHALLRVKHPVDMKVTPHDPICSGLAPFLIDYFSSEKKEISEAIDSDAILSGRFRLFRTENSGVMET